MRLKHFFKLDRKSRFLFIISIAKIVADITMIIGFAIVLYFMVKIFLL